MDSEVTKKRISRIRAKGLLSSYSIDWRVRSGVNILSGQNGSGKSTLLRALAHTIVTGEQPHSAVIDTVEVEGFGGQSIDSDDLLILSRDLGGFCSLGSTVREFSEQDFYRFCDIIDRMLEHSGKSINRDVNLEGQLSDLALSFKLVLLDGREVDLAYEYLSAGERLLISMFRAILERPTASILVLDEPEISLSMEWQKCLIENILELRPGLQLFIATHSPAIIMRGWVDCVVEIDDIIQ